MGITSIAMNYINLKKYLHQALLCTLLTLAIVLSLTSVAAAQLEIIRGVEQVSTATGASDIRHENSRENLKAEQERQQIIEDEVFRQREALRNNPGSFPRERLSDEARLSNNPWAREAKLKAGGAVTVELFVTPDCADCKLMEKYLNEVGVPYGLYELTKGSQAEQKYLTQIGRGVIPAIRINRDIVRGYKPEEVRKVILENK
jgi:glutaredoxin